MVERDPIVDLAAFSSPGASATAWAQGREELVRAELYWLSTVRPDGRPHVTPLLGVWHEGALNICTGPDERKAKNLTQNPNCVLTTGRNDLDGLDVVVEGKAVLIDDERELGKIAGAFETKYGRHFAPQGTWAGLGDAIRDATTIVYRVAPSVAFGFGKGEQYSQTRWSFS